MSLLAIEVTIIVAVPDTAQLAGFYERAYSEVDISVAPDFVKLAAAYGAGAFRATRPEELADVLASGLAHDGPAVIEVRVSKEENVFPIVPAGANSRDMIVQSGV